MQQRQASTAPRALSFENTTRPSSVVISNAPLLRGAQRRVSHAPGQNQGCTHARRAVWPRVQRARTAGSRRPRCPPPARPGTRPAARRRVSPGRGPRQRLGAPHEAPRARARPRASTASASAMKASTSAGSYSTITCAPQGGAAQRRGGGGSRHVARHGSGATAATRHFRRRRVELGAAGEAPCRVCRAARRRGGTGGAQRRCSALQRASEARHGGERAQAAAGGRRRAGSAERFTRQARSGAHAAQLRGATQRHDTNEERTRNGQWCSTAPARLKRQASRARHEWRS